MTKIAALIKENIEALKSVKCSECGQSLDGEIYENPIVKVHSCRSHLEIKLLDWGSESRCRHCMSRFYWELPEMLILISPDGEATVRFME